MDNFQFWLYIIIGVVYLLSRLRKKPAQEQPTDFPTYGEPEKPVRQFEQPSAKPSVPPGKPLTFEELLREITEGKTTTTAQPKPVVASKPEYVDYDEDLEDEEDDKHVLEKVDYDYRKQDKVYDIYEEAKRQAFVRPSLEETMKLADTDVRYGKFKEFEHVQRRDLVSEYLAEFKDPEGLKKAIIMSEILQRKF